MPKRRITANGELVEESETDTSDNNNSTWSFSDRLDVFGFSLEWKQFFVVLVLAMVILGPQGSGYTSAFWLQL
jgi:hypothetical protein